MLKTLARKMRSTVANSETPLTAEPTSPRYVWRMPKKGELYYHPTLGQWMSQTPPHGIYKVAISDQ